jgi:choline dehydrogenase-like flavoprotein
VDRYDVIIIGTGAGGGTLTHALAPTGKRILLLERGDFVRRKKANWDPRQVNVEGRYQTKEVWHDRDGNPLHPHTNYAVGGNTKFYGAALIFRKEDFGELRHHGGVSPAWPISYEELELAVNDFYFGSDQFPFPMGHISFVGKLDAATLSAGAPAIAPGWTLELMARHSLDFWLTSEDLPDPDNRVSPDGEGNIVLSYRPNNQEGHKQLIKTLEAFLQNQASCPVHGKACHQGLLSRNLFLGQRIPLAGVAHQNGTIRFGRGPGTSALDVNCRAHEVDNLYVVDGSFFPSSAAVNPALTITANALRVGDHLKARLG